MMARRLFPDESGNISMTYTPMIYTARLVKHTHPGSKVVFIGPCAAKSSKRCSRSCEATWISS